MVSELNNNNKKNQSLTLTYIYYNARFFALFIFLVKVIFLLFKIGIFHDLFPTNSLRRPQILENTPTFSLKMITYDISICDSSWSFLFRPSSVLGLIFLECRINGGIAGERSVWLSYNSQHGSHFLSFLVSTKVVCSEFFYEGERPRIHRRTSLKRISQISLNCIVWLHGAFISLCKKENSAD